MGLLSCFQPDSAGLTPEVIKLTTELDNAKENAAQLKLELLQLQSERVHLLHELSSRPVSPSKQDAGTEMPTVSVAVQVKPPITMESRIPRPTADDNKEGDVVDGSKPPVKSRIPAAPGVISAAAAGEPACCSPGHCSPRSPAATRGQLSTESAALAAAVSAVPSPRDIAVVVNPTAEPSAMLMSPKEQQAAVQESTADNGESVTNERPQLQRVEVLQQQLKVAEAFRLSLEAELRDARFTNNNLQTQMLSLQNKFEKTVEEQVVELERLNSLRKEGHDSHEQAMQQVNMLRRQLSFSKKECNAALRDAEMATKESAKHEQKLQQVTELLEGTHHKLTTCLEELAAKNVETGSLAVQLQEVQEKLAAAEARVQQLDEELKAQKALYDSTVDELLSLNTTYNDLKQSYHKLQSETKQHGEMVHLVQQELSELSYYAAAGRVALGLAPATSMRNFTPRDSEVSMPPDYAHSIEGALANLAPTCSANLAAAAEQVAAIVAEVAPSTMTGSIQQPSAAEAEAESGTAVEPATETPLAAAQPTAREGVTSSNAKPSDSTTASTVYAYSQAFG